jgi:hypothetical protein
MKVVNLDFGNEIENGKGNHEVLNNLSKVCWCCWMGRILGE